jgi:hypothetical protein
LQVVSLPTSSYVHVEKYGMEGINWTSEESRQEPLNGLSPTQLKFLFLVLEVSKMEEFGI